MGIKEIRKNIFKVWKLVKNQRKNLILVAVLSVILSCLSIVTPIISAKLLVNLTDGKWNELFQMALFLLITNLAISIIRYGYGRFSQFVLKEMSMEIQYLVASAALELETACFDNNSTGLFIQRLGGDTQDIVHLFTSININIIEIITNIGILVAAFLINRTIFFYFLIVMVILFIINVFRINDYTRLNEKHQDTIEKNVGFSSELIRGIRDIKLLNIDQNFLKMLRFRLKKQNQEVYQMGNVNRKYGLIESGARSLFSFGFIFLGAMMCQLSKMSIASCLVLYNYRERIYSSLQMVVNLVSKLKEFNVAAKRIFEVIDGEQFPKEQYGTTVLKQAKGSITFQHVSFSYTKNLPVLEDLNFLIHENETVAIVGRSGAGKSTILSLLAKLYHVDEGEIQIDGIPLETLDKKSLHDNISIIPQNPYIFHLSIRDNLRLAKEDLNEQEMIRVCKLACLHDDIVSLPDGYDTIIGEGGITLSGGQRQRLAIARAFLKKTEIILLDEATSSLDNDTQEHIQKAIHNLKRSNTVLIVAHRLSTIIDSDRILVLEHGKIVGEGTHEDLLKDNPFYQSLYEKELRQK